ncbi:MAG: zf-HC2 domain-containing protein [Acidobacteria bacterium]|nr:zf-HC2 domain-containing protein [Acidobacteriota bacterium]
MSPCREFEDLLPLHAVGETGLDEALVVEEHLGGCPACREELVALRELSVSLRRELGDVPAVPDPWPAGTSTPGATGSVLGLAGWRGVALAAGLLLAGILVGRWSMPEQPGMSTPTPVISTAGAVAPSLLATALRRPAAFSVFSPAARRFLSEVAHGKGQAISPARTQP